MYVNSQLPLCATQVVISIRKMFSYDQTARLLYTFGLFVH